MEIKLNFHKEIFNQFRASDKDITSKIKKNHIINFEQIYSQMYAPIWCAEVLDNWIWS